MAAILNTLMLCIFCAAFSTAVYVDGWGSSSSSTANRNPQTATWEKIFQSNTRSSVLPLFRHENKLYYMGVQFRARWQNAFQFCESLHMKLLTIHSDEENERIHKYIRDASKGSEYWIGGTRLVDGFSWVWMPYGSQIDYTKWSNGQPSDINEKCLQLWITDNKLTWNDRDCNAEFYFICERYMDSNNSGPPGASL
ncbi:C-type lectin mosGCTL-7-like [Diabrotica undecimpunctata]|uniref:C-type lectin mosGCTL-7-like n=1 Tax=Diabrotica undecimpunctata TaxID=50387 RepID=UPI003B6382D2